MRIGDMILASVAVLVGWLAVELYSTRQELDDYKAGAEVYRAEMARVQGENQSLTQELRANLTRVRDDGSKASDAWKLAAENLQTRLSASESALRRERAKPAPDPVVIFQAEQTIQSLDCLEAKVPEEELRAVNAAFGGKK